MKTFWRWSPPCMPPGRATKFGSAATPRLPAIVQRWSGCRARGQVRTTKAARLARATATQVRARPRGGPGSGAAGVGLDADEPEGGASVALKGWRSRIGVEVALEPPFQALDPLGHVDHQLAQEADEHDQQAGDDGDAGGQHEGAALGLGGQEQPAQVRPDEQAGADQGRAQAAEEDDRLALEGQQELEGHHVDGRDRQAAEAELGPAGLAGPVGDLDLADPVALVVGHDQDVAVPLGAQVQAVGDLAAERLDPVEVMDLEAEQEPAGDVGDPARDPLAVAAALTPAGDDVVALVEPAEQQRDVDLGVGLEVGGEEHDDLAPRLPEAAVEGLGEPEAPPLADQPDPGLVGGLGLDGGGRAVAGAVVDVDQLPGAAEVGEDLRRLLDQCRDGGDLVVGRHDDRDQCLAGPAHRCLSHVRMLASCQAWRHADHLLDGQTGQSALERGPTGIRRAPDTPRDRRSPWPQRSESGCNLYWRSMLDRVHPLQPAPRERRLLMRLCLLAFCGGLLLLLSSRPAEARGVRPTPTSAWQLGTRAADPGPQRSPKNPRTTSTTRSCRASVSSG